MTRHREISSRSYQDKSSFLLNVLNFEIGREGEREGEGYKIGCEIRGMNHLEGRRRTRGFVGNYIGQMKR